MQRKTLKKTVWWHSLIFLVLLSLPACRESNTSTDTNADDHAIEGVKVHHLPKQFTDQVRFDFGEKQVDGQLLLAEPVGLQIKREDEVSFSMTRVPGDEGKGIEPFYLSTVEVHAGMFWPWATGMGLAQQEWEHWRTLDLRPSRIPLDARSYGPDERPAMAMSRRVAELYCEWLSKQTGRAYRLPTESEWEHALQLGGGVPSEKELLLDHAALAENALWLDEPPFGERPSRVGTHKPNALGLYDMLGNAAEWVADTGEKRVVRGGHFRLKADQLSADWRGVEDVEVWNASSVWVTPPGEPTNWYRDFFYPGIRLACDADQAPRQAAIPQAELR